MSTQIAAAWDAAAELFRDADFRTACKCSQHGMCIEVAISTEGVVAVRDSKDPRKRTLAFTHDEWETFVEAVKNGEFDLPR